MMSQNKYICPRIPSHGPPLLLVARRVVSDLHNGEVIDDILAPDLAQEGADVIRSAPRDIRAEYFCHHFHAMSRAPSLALRDLP